jgi:short-subunit dehydrogenase
MTLRPWTTALVTGASSGIGEALAHQLAVSGTHTIVVARRTDRLQALANANANIEVLTADLASTTGVATVIARLNSASAPVDLLVNNAGFGVGGAVVDAPADRALGMIDVNVRALTELTLAVLPRLVAERRGWILQVSSVAGFQPGPTSAIYSATKAYVTSFTEALHEELRGTGVNVCALCPGFTHSEFHATAGGDASDLSRVPSFAWLAAAEVARSGLDAVAEGRALDVPGALYKGLGAFSAVLPRRAARRLMGAVTSNRR